MSDIAQQMAQIVNDSMPAVGTALAPIFEVLEEARATHETMTPSKFADHERKLVEAVVELGRQCCLRLVESQAAHAPIVSMCDDNGHFSRLEPTGRRVVTAFGTGRIERSRYRRLGTHNGATFDPVEVRCGLLDNMTPAAASLTGALLAAVPSREAHRLVRQVGIKHLSRCAIERGGHAVGQHLQDHREVLENALVESFEMPERAVAVSVSVDRISVPIEKPRKRRRGRPAGDAPRRPVEVVYEMAYVGCWTLYDDDGRVLYTCRYGQMSGTSSALRIEEQLRFDLQGLLEHRPGLKVCALSDGALEMIQMLERVTRGIDGVVQLVDYWHAVEYVAKALSAMQMDVKRELGKVKRSLLTATSGARKTLMRLRTWAVEHEALHDEVAVIVDDAIRFFTNKTAAGLMDYAATRAAGLPVGSGSVEATAKTLVAMRMKRSGCRWKHASGQHVLTLRSLTTSSRWDESCRWRAERLDQSMSAFVEVA